MNILTVLVIIWILISVCYGDEGFRFIQKIKNPFKAILFGFLLGPLFWILVVVAVIAALIILGLEFVFNRISHTFEKTKDWWLK